MARLTWALDHPHVTHTRTHTHTKTHTSLYYVPVRHCENLKEIATHFKYMWGCVPLHFVDLDDLLILTELYCLGFTVCASSSLSGVHVVSEQWATSR